MSSVNGPSGVTPLEGMLAALGAEDAPTGFELGVLKALGIAQSRYDTYALVDSPAGGLYVAGDGRALTGAMLAAVVADRREFEEQHLARTGRSVISAADPPAGVRPALRTGRASGVAIDLAGLSALEQAVLGAVRRIPRGQIRPVSWVAHEAGLTATAPVVEALARNPVHVLIPCHRVADDSGRPYDAAYGHDAGEALRRAEGMDPQYIESLTRLEMVFLGSDTTHIYCHPTCAHARRITPPHRVPFRSAAEARHAGYRPCKSCRPVPA
ncbi:MGMT family protein [Streptomyces sp. NPDC049585]|uniref:MGMT family protein n=1 Tax=Streptomyces sp. NPDC049585 TaxID=3155154 RepID=UPI00342FC834